MHSMCFGRTGPDHQVLQADPGNNSDKIFQSTNYKLDMVCFYVHRIYLNPLGNALK